MIAKPSRHITSLALAAGLFCAPALRAEIGSFYVGQDSLPNVRFGPHAGTPSPNHNRLTFLYAHAFPENPLNNHYHAIGIYDKQGPTNATIIVETNANNRIPESFTGQAPLTLVLATNGLYAGKLTSAKTAEHYSGFTIRSVHTLRYHVTPTATNEFGYGSGEYVMFRSNVDGRTNRLDNVVVAMELVSKSSGLHVGSSSQIDVLNNPGDRLVLGSGNSFVATPVAWVESNTPPGNYDLRFKLVDVGTENGHVPLPESGIVTFNFRVVSAPQLMIGKFVHVSMPLVTDGHVLESAPTVNGPWEPAAGTAHEDLIGEGESAVQVGTKTLEAPIQAGNQFYRLRKL